MKKTTTAMAAAMLLGITGLIYGATKTAKLAIN
jgi:hypothetical protein